MVLRIKSCLTDDLSGFQFRDGKQGREGSVVEVCGLVVVEVKYSRVEKMEIGQDRWK